MNDRIENCNCAELHAKVEAQGEIIQQYRGKVDSLERFSAQVVAIREMVKTLPEQLEGESLLDFESRLADWQSAALKKLE